MAVSGGSIARGLDGRGWRSRYARSAFLSLRVGSVPRLPKATCEPSNQNPAGCCVPTFCDPTVSSSAVSFIKPRSSSLIMSWLLLPKRRCMRYVQQRPQPGLFLPSRCTPTTLTRDPGFLVQFTGSTVSELTDNAKSTWPFCRLGDSVGDRAWGSGGLQRHHHVLRTNR
jgi:hypothetical protein